MKYLIFSDLHITQEYLEECGTIFEEIYSIYSKINPDKIVILGDTFHNTKPTVEELTLFATFISKIKSQIIIIVAKSHESSTNTNSIFDVFKILKNNLVIGYHSYVDNDDEGKILFGHFMLKESILGFKENISVKDVKDQYRWVFLGHQHIFQKIAKNVYHVGSSRYVRFDENEKVKKYVIFLDSKLDKMQKIELSSPIPIVNIVYNNENDLNIDPKHKVRIIFTDKNKLNDWLKISDKYSNKFYSLKIKVEYNNCTNSSLEIQKNKNFCDSFIDYINHLDNIELQQLFNAILK